MEASKAFTVTDREVNGFRIREYTPERTPTEERTFSRTVTRIVRDVLRQHGHTERTA